MRKSHYAKMKTAR